MAVSAGPDNDLPPTATSTIDLRTDAAVRAGTYLHEGPDVPAIWHCHPYHQLEYALAGVAEVETASGRYLLPPQQAIWIPAGLVHATTLHDVRSAAVFFDPTTMSGPCDRARVLAASPVIREMIVHALRWPISRTDRAADANTFFDALAGVVIDHLDNEAPLRLPTTNEPVMAAVISFTDENLSTVTAASVCRAVGLSERTLRRRFPEAVGTTWSTYLQQSRVLRAMTLLADGDHTVLHAAISVGFDSPSAFTRAFKKATGESPSAYRRRVHHVSEGGGTRRADPRTSSTRSPV